MKHSSWLQRQLCFAVFCVLILSTTACTHVEPWERGNLTKEQMSAEPHPEHSALLKHIHSSREAAATGAASKGSGCGCY